MNYASIRDLWFQRQIETQMISQHLSLIYSANTTPLNRQHNFFQKSQILPLKCQHSDGPSVPSPLLSVSERKSRNYCMVMVAKQSQIILISVLPSVFSVCVGQTLTFGFYFIPWCELCLFHGGLSGKIIFTGCCYYCKILQAYLLTNNTSAHTQRR